MRTLVLCSSVFAAVSICAAQGPAAQGPTVMGAGFANPFPIAVAPGQSLTLFVQPGAGYDPSAPLPSVSAVYWNGSTGETMPLLQVNQTEAACNVPPNSGCTNLLAVTVQVPFDAPIVPSTVSNVIVVPSSVAVSINGATTSYFGVQPSQDHVHILTACDLIAGASPGFLAYQGTFCAPLVTHADGKTVSAILPATVGEELIAYATGLGQTNPPLTTGHPATQSSPTVDAFNLDFNYRNNAHATQPLSTGPVPLFAGATQGFVGLYQINFVVPPATAGTLPCVDFAVMPLDATNAGGVVHSNLTVSVGSAFWFDGAGICVQTPPVP
jgi:uncharacterized protein (TIGR03437 family)